MDTTVSECTICFEDFTTKSARALPGQISDFPDHTKTDQQARSILACQHGSEIHYHCILEWVEKDPTCPTCRAELFDSSGNNLGPIASSPRSWAWTVAITLAALGLAYIISKLLMPTADATKRLTATIAPAFVVGTGTATWQLKDRGTI